MDTHVTYGYEVYAGCTCDFTINVQTTTFLVHRNHLAKESSFFRAMFNFSHGSNREQSVSLDQEKPHIFKILIDFCYTQELALKSLEVFRLANKYMFERIESIMLEYFSVNVNFNNYLHLKTLAVKFNKATLYEDIFNFSLKNFDSIMKNENFVKMDEDFLVKLIRDDNLNVFREYTVLEAVKKWISFCEKEDRQVKFDLLIEHVRFFAMSFEELTEIHEEHKNLSLKNLVKEALIYKSATMKISGDHKEVDRRNICHRKFIKRNQIPSRDCLFAIGNFSDCPCEADRYDIEQEQWFDMAHMKFARSSCEIVIIGDYLYALGGHRNGHNLRLTERYHIPTNTWHQDVAPMILARCFFAAVSIGRFIFCLGGCNDTKSGLVSVEQYCLATNSWVFCNSPNTREGRVHDACSMNGKIWAFIEEPYNPIYLRLESYDPHDDAWTSVTSVPKISNFIKCCPVGCDQIYIVARSGADDELDYYINSYNITTGGWLRLQTQTQRRYQSNIVNLRNERLFIFGCNEKTRGLSIEIFDLKTNKSNIGVFDGVSSMNVAVYLANTN